MKPTTDTILVSNARYHLKEMETAPWKPTRPFRFVNVIQRWIRGTSAFPAPVSYCSLFHCVVTCDTPWTYASPILLYATCLSLPNGCRTVRWSLSTGGRAVIIVCIGVVCSWYSWHPTAAIRVGKVKPLRHECTVNENSKRTSFRRRNARTNKPTVRRTCESQKNWNCSAEMSGFMTIDHGD